jgi:hypothetical protein
MGYRLMSNKVNGRVTIHVAAANSGDIIVVGNNSVSNLTSNAAEIISGAIIRRIFWGTDTNWSIKRGANVVLVLTQTGQMDFEGCAINLDPAANVSANTSSANGFLILELAKTFTTMANTGY